MTWKKGNLGELTTILSGTTPKSEVKAFWNGTHTWITPTDLGKLKGFLIHKSERSITDEGIKHSNLSLIPKGAVVMSSRAPIGHLGIAGRDFYTNQGCKSFVCGSKINNEFLYFMLFHRMKDIQELGSGATFVEVSKSALQGFEISYPDSISEQRRIAAQLIAQLAEVEKAQNALVEQRRDACRLTTRLQGQALEILKAIDRVRLGTLIKGIEAGKSMKTTELPAKEDELGVLKLSAISWNQFKPQEAKSIQGNYQPDELHRVKKGDLIISRANTIELVGAVVMVEKDYPNRLLSDKTLRLVIDEEQVIPEYLLHILKLPEARTHIEGNATGTSDSMRNISQPTIRSIPVPFAKKSQQREIIDILEATNKKIHKIEGAIDIMLDDLIVLPKKILAEAFDN